MKKWLGVIAVVALLCGLSAGGLGLWLHYRARAQAVESRELQEKSFESEEKSDDFRGTPEEGKLLLESQRYEAAASAALDSAKRNSKLAVFSGVGSIILILASIAMIVVNVKRKEAE